MFNNNIVKGEFCDISGWDFLIFDKQFEKSGIAISGAN